MKTTSSLVASAGRLARGIASLGLLAATLAWGTAESFGQIFVNNDPGNAIGGGITYASIVDPDSGNGVLQFSGEIVAYYFEPENRSWFEEGDPWGEIPQDFFAAYFNVTEWVYSLTGNPIFGSKLNSSDNWMGYNVAGTYYWSQWFLNASGTEATLLRYAQSSSPFTVDQAVAAVPEPSAATAASAAALLIFGAGRARKTKTRSICK